MKVIWKVLIWIGSFTWGTFGFAAPNANSWLVKDLMVSGPPLLTQEQILEDVAVYEQILQDAYARYPILQQQGVNWEAVFSNLRASLTASNRPWVTNQFLHKLIEALHFTNDPSLHAEVSVYKRLYTAAVPPFSQSFTRITLARHQNRYRVLPEVENRQIANFWFVRCDGSHYRFFPTIPERQGEQRVRLGMFTFPPPTHLDCQFEHELGQTVPHQLPLQKATVSESTPRNQNPVYTWISGHIPYLRWHREGKPQEDQTRDFYQLVRQLKRHQAFILDVRDNTSGSFGFIEKFFHPLTRTSWQNGVLREKQSVITLEGVLNRLQALRQQVNLPPAERAALGQEKQRLEAMLSYVRRQHPPLRWVETKFSFAGDPEASNWSRRMIVVANRRCGDGCQFLAALAKQTPNSFLVGENTGAFPRNIKQPLYQLPHSRIRISVSHILHLNERKQPVPASGYEPDFWLDDPTSLDAVYRLARSNFP